MFIEIQLVYNVVLVSGVQQRDSDFPILFTDPLKPET